MIEKVNREEHTSDLEICRSLAIARQLCVKDEHLAEKVKPLLDMAEMSIMGTTLKRSKQSEAKSEENEKMDEFATDLELSVLEMEKRLQELQEAKVLAPQATSVFRVANPTLDRMGIQEKVCKQLQGWAPASQDWKSTPIGCLDGIVPNLVLPDL